MNAAPDQLINVEVGAPAEFNLRSHQGYTLSTEIETIIAQFTRLYGQPPAHIYRWKCCFWAGPIPEHQPVLEALDDVQP